MQTPFTSPTPGKPLAGKIAVVTGASGGIGRLVAGRLAQDGAVVGLHHRNGKDAVSATIADIHRNGGYAFELQADLADLATIPSMLETLDGELAKRSGAARFDILVNNAGIAPQAGFADTDEALFERVIATNMRGPFFLTQSLLPRLNDGSRIINVSSLVTLRAYPQYALYAMSKAAISSLTLTLAKQLGPRGITVNAVAPGATDTDINAGWLKDPIARKAVADDTALGRVGVASDIVGAIAFLASPDGGWVTGQVIANSGGAGL